MPAPSRLLFALPFALPLVAIGGCSPTPRPSKVVRLDDVSADTARARTENDTAVDLMARGKLTGAAEALDRAVAADPRFGPAQNNLGIVDLRRSQPSAAAEAFARAADLMPHAAAPRNNLGLVLESAGRYDEAVRSYDAAVALEPANPEYVGNAARGRVRRGDQTDELRRLLDRVATDPRPEWSAWARETLARWPRPTTSP